MERRSRKAKKEFKKKSGSSGNYAWTKFEYNSLLKYIDLETTDLDKIVENYNQLFNVSRSFPLNSVTTTSRDQYLTLPYCSQLFDPEGWTEISVPTFMKSDGLTEGNSGIRKLSKSEVIVQAQVLRRLKQEYRQKASHRLLVKIRKLSQQLRSQCDTVFAKNLRRLRFLGKTFILLLHADGRLHFRTIVSFLYKCMSDFSGVEEEVATSFTRGTHPFFHQHNVYYVKQIRVSGRIESSYRI